MPPLTKEQLHLLEQAIPFNRYLGIRLVETRAGYTRMELPFRDEFIGDPLRPALHGGTLSTLIDTCGGFAVWTTIGIEDRVSTIDMRVDYLAPGRPEALVAEGIVVRTGNRVGVADVKVWQPSQPDRLVAVGKGVYNIKRRDET